MALTQYAFRFRNDDGSESAAMWAGAESANINLIPGANVRIRIGVDATGDPTNQYFQLEYRHKPNGGSFGAWAKVNVPNNILLESGDNALSESGDKIIKESINKILLESGDAALLESGGVVAKE